MDLSVLECPEPARRSPSGRIEKLLNLGSARAGGFNVLELEHLHIHVAGTPGKDTFDLHLMARMRFRITEASQFVRRGSQWIQGDGLERSEREWARRPAKSC